GWAGAPHGAGRLDRGPKRRHPARPTAARPHDPSGPDHLSAPAPANPSAGSGPAVPATPDPASTAPGDRTRLRRTDPRSRQDSYESATMRSSRRTPKPTPPSGTIGFRESLTQAVGVMSMWAHGVPFTWRCR